MSITPPTGEQQMRDLITNEFMSNQHQLNKLLQLKLAEYDKRIETLELRLNNKEDQS